ncbi:MAG TPA: hypothetical protein VF190_15395, partial [Rhodothermales bacterium]
MVKALFHSMAVAVALSGAVDVHSAPSYPVLDSGIERENLDTTVRPQDDFYRYVNGSWMQRNTIPPDRASLTAFVELDDAAEKNLHAIIEEAIAA